MSSGTTYTTSDTGEPDIAVREFCESNFAKSNQGVDDRDPGYDGYNCVATKCDCAVSGSRAKSCATLAGSDATGMTEMDTQQAPAEHCTEPRKPQSRFLLAMTRPTWLTGTEESEPALGEQTRGATETLEWRKRRRHQAT